MKPGRILLILGILIVGTIIYFNKCNKEQAAGPGSSQKNQPLQVNGVVISIQPIEEKIFSSGTLIANDEVEIRNEIPGRITSLLFREGTKVRKGELLITLFDEDLNAQLRKLESQKAIAQKTVERQQDLLKVNGISQQELDITENEFSSIQADIDLILAQLSKTRIRAPFDGVIGLRAVSSGAFLPVNTRIATIQDVSPLKLEFALPERYRSAISENTIIKFRTESAEGIFEGKIYAFEPKIDLQTRSVIVRATSPNDDGLLFPGAFAHIEIPLKRIDNAIMVPTQALVPELRGENVYIVRNDSAKKIPVEIGLRNDSSVQITSGLTEGDTVLITGIMQVRPGSPLQVKVNSPITSR